MKFFIEHWAKLSESLPGECAGLDRTAAEELVELWRFLSIFRYFPLPLTVTKRERPDFALEPPIGEVSVGLEHTWAADESWEQTEQYPG